MSGPETKEVSPLDKATRKMGEIMKRASDSMPKDESDIVKKAVDGRASSGFKLEKRSTNSAVYDTLKVAVDRNLKDTGKQVEDPNFWSAGVESKYTDKETGLSGFMITGKEKGTYYFMMVELKDAKDKVMSSEELEKLAKQVSGSEVTQENGLYERMTADRGVIKNAELKGAIDSLKAFKEKPGKKSGEWLQINGPDANGAMKEYVVIFNSKGTLGDGDLIYFRKK